MKLLEPLMSMFDPKSWAVLVRAVNMPLSYYVVAVIATYALFFYAIGYCGFGESNKMILMYVAGMLFIFLVGCVTYILAKFGPKYLIYRGIDYIAEARIEQEGKAPYNPPAAMAAISRIMLMT